MGGMRILLALRARYSNIVTTLEITLLNLSRIKSFINLQKYVSVLRYFSIDSRYLIHKTMMKNGTHLPRTQNTRETPSVRVLGIISTKSYT